MRDDRLRQERDHATCRDGRSGTRPGFHQPRDHRSTLRSAGSTRAPAADGGGRYAMFSRHRAGRRCRRVHRPRRYAGGRRQRRCQHHRRIESACGLLRGLGSLHYSRRAARVARSPVTAPSSMRSLCGSGAAARLGENHLGAAAPEFSIYDI